MAEKQKKELLGARKFGACYSRITGEDADGQRRLCACFLIRNTIWHLLTAPESRTAVEIAEKYPQAEIDQKALVKLRRDIRKHQGANRSVYVLTFPFKFNSLGNLGDLICNSLINKYVQDHPDVEWGDAKEKIEDNTYHQMAELVMRFLRMKSAPDIKSLLDDPLLKKYYVKYFNPYSLRDWALTMVKEKQRKKRLLDAIECFLDVPAHACQTESELGPIVQLCTSKLKYDRDIGMKLLLPLGVHHAVARDSLLHLLSHADAPVRFTASTEFTYWHLPYPKKYVRDFLLLAMKDRSAKNRLFAYEGIHRYSRNDLLPELKAAIKVEKDGKARNHLANLISYIEHGFYFMEGAGSAPSKMTIAIRLKHGNSTIKEISTAMTHAQIKDFVAEIQKSQQYVDPE